MVNSLTQDIFLHVSTPDKEQERIIAAIDIGTNSIHMVVVRIDPKLPAFTIIGKEKDTVRLGNCNPRTGELTPEAMNRAIATLQRCKEMAASLNAENIVAVATSAVREAPNGQAFLHQVYTELGLLVNLISGQEEARRIYLGVLSAMEFNNHPHIIIDIGGGSTELILGDRHNPRSLSSTKIGAVRLTKEFVTTDPISQSEFLYLQAYVRGMLERAVDDIQANLKLSEQPRLVGTSGTIETLAKMHAYEHLGMLPNPLTGYEVSRQDLEKMLKGLAAMSLAERSTLPEMSERRSEIIVAGAIILLEAMKLLGMESLIICGQSLREGLIVDWMLTHGLIEDRLRYQDEVRERSVLAVAGKYQVNLDYSQRVADFALSLFEQTQGKLHNWGTQARELLWAAAILHNCGVYISHSAHHKHSYYLIRHAELLGFLEPEIEIIANLARYHRKSPPKKKHENYNNLANQEHRLLVSQLSALLRLAIALDRRQIGAIRQVKSDYRSDDKALHLYLVPAFANDDCALELWNLDYKKSVFEEEFGVKVVASLASKSRLAAY
ncbi:Ppx/GppA phosphatase family protein [Moorena sp. SIO3H5]|uniref:Ppx/GppA phosphatase family protein n=1 Tax=Moorena sp. SIO3H5 TaxID=2607834 RepID=UPI0013B972D6|nr:Ppx/GppA phosphatase family protein [Moorena sp. SIO3H5]NEO68551.1 Ppx/GppA family phosphatase [Moorena sp. SIO3H5]